MRCQFCNKPDTELIPFRKLKLCKECITTYERHKEKWLKGEEEYFTRQYFYEDKEYLKKQTDYFRQPKEETE